MSPKFITALHLVHDSMITKVMENRDASQSFPATNGVKPVYVLVPMLFSLLFTNMLSAAFHKKNDDF